MKVYNYYEHFNVVKLNYNIWFGSTMHNELILDGVFSCWPNYLYFHF